LLRVIGGVIDDELLVVSEPEAEVEELGEDEEV